MSHPPIPGEPTKVSVFGAEGEGKSAYLRARLAAVGARRWIAVDPTYSMEEAPGRTASIVGAGPDVAGKIHAAIARARGSRFGIVVVPTPGCEGDAALAAARYARETGAILIVDEAHETCPAHGAPPEIVAVARMGRHTDSALWLASQRPADVSRSLTAGSERVLFALDEPRDLQYVASAVGKRAADIVADLPRLQFLYRYRRACYVGRIEFGASGARMRLVRSLAPSDLA